MPWERLVACRDNGAYQISRRNTFWGAEPTLLARGELGPHRG